MFLSFFISGYGISNTIDGYKFACKDKLFLCQVNGKKEIFNGKLRK